MHESFKKYRKSHEWFDMDEQEIWELLCCNENCGDDILFGCEYFNEDITYLVKNPVKLIEKLYCGKTYLSDCDIFGKTTKYDKVKKEALFLVEKVNKLSEILQWIEDTEAYTIINDNGELKSLRYFQPKTLNQLN